MYLFILKKAGGILQSPRSGSFRMTQSWRALLQSNDAIRIETVVSPEGSSESFWCKLNSWRFGDHSDEKYWLTRKPLSTQ